MAQKKEQMLKEYIERPIEAGDYVDVPQSCIQPYGSESKTVLMKVLSNDNGVLKLVEPNNGKAEPVLISADAVQKNTLYIGANPFRIRSWMTKSRNIAFDIESILLCLFEEYKKHCGVAREPFIINGIHIKETNFSPYVLDKDGNKCYYQRELCWSLEDKQNLIDSIYHGYNCGQVIIRKRKYEDVIKAMENGDAEICMKDVVDGKQRLCCIFDFVMDRFTDKEGNYFSDLSVSAQRTFERSMTLTYCEMSENSTDRDVIDAFLNVNFAGIPQTNEHIRYVQHISDIMK